MDEIKGASAATDFVERFLGARRFAIEVREWQKEYPGMHFDHFPKVENLVLPPFAYSDRPRQRIRWLKTPWRNGCSSSFFGGEAPSPFALIKAHPDRLEDMFYRDEGGRLWCDAKSYGMNFLDFSNPKLADILVEDFKEYYRNPSLTEKAHSNGVYYTGDVVYYDERGYYWFVSRADDVIKSSGYRIGPFEVESALMTHPAVVECAITGVPDDIRGMVVKATVVLADEYRNQAGPELIKELQDHVKRETAPYKYPRIIEFVDELPKTISGKIRRVEIREHDGAK